jgi:hypothetical protein
MFAFAELIGPSKRANIQGVHLARILPNRWRLYRARFVGSKMRYHAALLCALLALTPDRALSADIDWNYWQRQVVALGCEGAMDLAMVKLKARWIVKLIGSHFGCEVAVESVLGPNGKADQPAPINNTPPLGHSRFNDIGSVAVPNAKPIITPDIGSFNYPAKPIITPNTITAPNPYAQQKTHCFASAKELGGVGTGFALADTKKKAEEDALAQCSSGFRLCAVTAGSCLY